MAIDFEPEVESNDFEGEDEASEIGAKASAQVAEISQPKKEGGSSFLGGFQRGSRDMQVTAAAERIAYQTTGDKPWGEPVQGIPEELQSKFEVDRYGFSAEDRAAWEQAQTYKERAAVFKAVDQRAIDEAFGDADRDGFTAMAGEFLGALVTDPVSALIPAGKSYRAVAGIGAATGAIQSILDDIADAEEISLKKAAYTSAFFAAGGTGLKAAGGVLTQNLEDPVFSAINSAVTKWKDRGRPLDAEKLSKEFSQFGASYGTADLNKLAQNLNATYGMSDTTPKVAKEVQGVKNDPNYMYGAEYKDVDLVKQDYRLGMADEFLTEYKIFNPKQDMGYGDLGVGKKKGSGGFTPATDLYYNKERTLSDLDNIIQNEQGYKQQKKRISKAGKVSYRDVKKFTPEIKQVRVDEPVEPTLAPNLEEALAKKREVIQYFNDVVPVGSSAYNRMSEDLPPMMSGPNQYDFFVGGKPSNKIIGGIENSEFVLNSPTAQRLSPSATEKIDLDNPTPKGMAKLQLKIYEYISKVITPVHTLLRSTNNAGKLAADLLEDATNNSTAQTANALHGYKATRASLGIKRGSVEEKQVAGILRGTVSRSEASPQAIKLAESLKKQFISITRAAVEAGSVTKEKGLEMLKSLQTKGYFPRVYNHEYLDTAEGRQHWMDVWTSKSFKTKEEAENAIAIAKGMASKIQGERSNLGIKEVVGENGTKYYKVPEGLAKLLYETRGKGLEGARSRHFQDRKIPEIYEEILNPFLIDDTEAVLTKYFQDVFNDIEFRKSFGAKDERALFLAKEIEKASPEAAKAFIESFYTSVRDVMNSRNLQNFFDKSESTRSGVRWLQNFQNLKLMSAGIANLGQASNSLVQIMGSDASFMTKMRTIDKGIRNSLSLLTNAERRATVQKFGATLQHLEMIATAHLHGKLKATDFINPLTLGKPQLSNTFLRGIGFFGSDAFSRNVSFEFGRAFAEETIQAKMALIAKGIKPGHPKMDKLNATLKEIGIDPDMDLSKVSLNEIEQAALAFDGGMQEMIGKSALKQANRTNFITAPHNMPIAAQSFWGKVFYKFKSYQIGQTQFLIDNAIKPALKGNFGGLATVLSVQATLGWGVDEARRWFLGDDREFTNAETYVRALGSIGGLTLMYDIATGAAKDEWGIVKWAAGPSVSTVTKGAYAIAKEGQAAVDDKEGNFGQATTKYLMKEFVFPYRKQLLETMKQKDLFEAKSFEDFDVDFEEK